MTTRMGLAIVLILAGCGGKHAAGTVPTAVATAFPAARWIPGHPTYVVSARTMREAQRGFVDVVDTAGVALGADPKQASAIFQQLLGVDPLSGDAVGAIGVDLDGSVALFSEDIDPTFVVHLSSPQAMQQFFEGQRKKGFSTQSVMVDGSELFTAKIAGELRISWAVDKDWLWVHFSGKDGNTWFEHSRHPSSADWVGGWEAAQKLGNQAAGLVGSVQLRELMAKIAERESALLACARLVEPVGGVGFAVGGDGKLVAGKLAVELGGSARDVAGKLMPPPPGWMAAATNAPVSAQWNLDLKAAATWFSPCARLFGIDVGVVDQIGVRTARAFVQKLDLDDKSGTGAVAFDLLHAKFFASQLDQIPLRSKFEKSRMFGAYKGKHLSVPFVATVDYVLDDRVAIAAMGDGLLDKIANGAASAQPPVFALDVLPRGLRAADLQFLLEQAGVPQPKRMAERLQSWNDIHFSARVDDARLVIEASGNRR